MKAKKSWIFVLALAICIGGLFSVKIWANSDEKPLEERIAEREFEKLLDNVRRESLMGLDGVALIIGKMRHVEKFCGLTEMKLQTDVELRLRQSGIKILEGKDWGKTPGKPHLLIWVTTLVPQVISNDSVAVDINVELHEDAVLLRNPKIYIPAVTWRRNWLGIITIDGFEDHIRGFIKDSVDQFCNDYLAANPKEQVGKKDSAEKRK